MTRIPFFEAAAPTPQGEKPLPAIPSKKPKLDFSLLMATVTGGTDKADKSEKSAKEAKVATKKKDSPDAAVASAMAAMLPLPITAPIEAAKPTLQRSSEKDTATPAEPVSESKVEGPPPAASKPAEAPASRSSIKQPLTEVLASAKQPAAVSISPPASDPVPQLPLDGTTDALTKERMKFGAEKKEIAGRTTQKVPTISSSKSVAVTASTDIAVQPVTAKSPVAKGADALVVMDWPAKPTEWKVGLTSNVNAPAPTDHAAVQVERVAHLVNQQAMMVRQSGANNLAVSLKVDPQTELFLQLTNHDGHIQASLRFERGTVAGLDSHWTDLQTSLARQNVELLPRQDKVSPSSATNFNFDQSANHSSRQKRDLRDEVSETLTVKPITTSTQTKTRTVSRQGWESWA